MLERRHDLLEELGRESVAFGQRGQRDRALAFVADQVDERAQAVLGAAGESHVRIVARNAYRAVVGDGRRRRCEHPCETALAHGRLPPDDGRPLAHPVGGPGGRGRPHHRGHAAPANARRVHRPARGQGQPVRAADGGAGQGRGRGPRPAVRPARPRQDDPRHDHRPRARGQRPLHVRTGGRAGRRPGRDPDLARRAGRPVHRRDPSSQPGGRGDPLSGDGGLRARRDDRQGPVGASPAAEPQAVHRRRRHDPGRAGSAARCATGSGRRTVSTSTRTRN